MNCYNTLKDTNEDKKYKDVKKNVLTIKLE